MLVLIYKNNLDHLLTVLVEVVFSGYPHVMPVSFVAKLFVFFYGIYLFVRENKL